MNLFNLLSKHAHYLNRCRLMKESIYSQSQFYRWLKEGVRERKARELKPVSHKVIKAAVEVVREYPHFSGLKGQCYMSYHQLGYIPQHIYKQVKRIVRRLVFQEVTTRCLLPERTSYEHERPEKPGEIWAEDFTELRVCGKKFYAALVIDVAMTYYRGVTASIRPDSKMVQAPVIQALEINDGKAPKRFLLSDNGSQYIGTQHGDFLNKLDIVQKRIPACKPEYNGSVECGIKEFKNVFYNVWAQAERSELAELEEKKLLAYVQIAIQETIRRMNEVIPRPSLKGVTAEDVRNGIAAERRELNRKYLETEQEKKEVIDPWDRKDWAVVKQSLFKRTISNIELMTKFCFFLKRPLRKLANLKWNLLGN